MGRCLRKRIFILMIGIMVAVVAAAAEMTGAVAVAVEIVKGVGVLGEVAVEGIKFCKPSPFLYSLAITIRRGIVLLGLIS